MDTTPEGYVADALTKALAVGIFAIPVFFVAKVLSLVVLAIAVTVWFLEYRNPHPPHENRIRNAETGRHG